MSRRDVSELLRAAGVLVFWAGGSSSAIAGTKSVVVVTDGPVAGSEVATFVDALREVSGSSVSIAEETPTFSGDWTVAGVQSAMEEAYALEPDVVITVGWGASILAARQEAAPAPTVAPWVLDPVLQGLTDEMGANVYPVRIHVGLQRYVDSLLAVTGAQKPALLADPMSVELLMPDGELGGLTAIEIPADLTQLEVPEDVDAVLVGPLDAYPQDVRQALAAALAQRGLPTFAMGGEGALEAGFMMSHTGLGDPTPVARNAALLAVNVLKGKAPMEVVWTPAHPGQRVIQTEVLASLGVAAPFDVLLEAKLVGQTDSNVETEGMEAMLDLAVSQSPELVAASASVDAARNDLVRTWSNWMPQAGVSATAAFVGDGVAAASLGQTSPASVGFEGGIHQLLYDDMARASIPIQQRLQAGRVAGFDARKLDVINQVAVAYVGALRADALIDVRQADLMSLQANLEAARVRVAVGDATDAEEARWEAEIAQARANLVDAYTQRRSVQMRVNQLVGRSPGQAFRPDNTIADDLMARFDESVVGASLDDPLRLRRLADVLVELGLERSPEIAQLDLGIDAQEAYLGATKRAYYVPRVGASVSGTWNAWRSDGGQGGIDLSGLPTGVNATLPQMPSAYATAGVSASLPLFEGRSRIADQSEASWDLIRLESERLRFEQLWELRIRTAVLDLEAAYQRVKMSKISVRGALRNLDWAQDAYARGLASQIQLLDARSETLQANVGLTDARFGLLASLIEVKRSIASDLAQGSEANLQKQISILLSEEGP